MTTFKVLVDNEFHYFIDASSSAEAEDIAQEDYPESSIIVIEE